MNSNINFTTANYPHLEKLIKIKADYLEGKLTIEQARQQIEENYTSISALEFAYAEQKIKDMGFDDDKVHENMNNLINLLDGILEKDSLDLPAGHPIRTYQAENMAMKLLLEQGSHLKDQDFNLEQWQNLANQLYNYNIHLARKQNQLFPKLEEKGFDRPSKIMWTFDNEVKNAISTLRDLIKKQDKAEIFKQFDILKEAALDLIDKEETVLYPTSIKLISDIEFSDMRKGDDEIGYCFIDTPVIYSVKTNQTTDVDPNLLKDLAELATKYNLNKKTDDVLDVKQGKLTLEQINLIYQHLPIDISYVDENELVKFYSDTTHRIFPRSANVIGRDVKNCHPRESVHIVEEIIETFRSGKQNKAEFWLEMGEKFIYITYIAVHDEKGQFRGVLEMMQDVAHIRSLEGQRRLLNWEDSSSKGDLPQKTSSIQATANPYGLNKDTTVYDMISKYPYLREYLPSISPKFEKILNPVAFNTIAKIATLEMAATRGNVEYDILIEKLTEKIKEEEKIEK